MALLINKKETRSLEQKNPTFCVAGRKSVPKNLVGTKMCQKVCQAKCKLSKPYLEAIKILKTQL